ncbi:MAG: hypothetical protein QOK28_3396 [Actinomycetota bacterium]|jgi:hypothetical protein
MIDRERELSGVEQLYVRSNRIDPGCGRLRSASVVRNDLIEPLMATGRAWYLVHDIERTTYHYEDGAYIARVHTPEPPISATVSTERADDVKSAVRMALEATDTPEDLTTLPYSSSYVVPLDDRTSLILSQSSHITIDAHSVLALAQPLMTAAITGQPQPVAEPEAQYDEYVAWERGLVNGPEGSQRKRWWQTRLATVRTATINDVRRGAAARHRGSAEHAVAATAQGAVFDRLAAAYFLTLSAMADTDTPVASFARSLRSEVPRCATTAGNLVDYVPVVVFVDPATSLGDFCGTVRDARLDSFAHYLPLATILELVGERWEANPTPLLQFMFNVQPAGAMEAFASDESIADSDDLFIPITRTFERQDLTLVVKPDNREHRWLLASRADAYSVTRASEIEAAVAATEKLIATSPDTTVREALARLDLPVPTIGTHS